MNHTQHFLFSCIPWTVHQDGHPEHWWALPPQRNRVPKCLLNMSYKEAAAQTTEHMEESQHGLYIQITRELSLCLPLSLQTVWDQQGDSNPEFATSS